jgi:RNA recognition motif-containing protein
MVPMVFQLGTQFQTKEVIIMGKKLYVGNLPFSVNDESLAEIFAQSGTVESAKVIMDRNSGRSKGFGFVEMSTDEEAQEAISQFDGQEHDGRALKVNEARPMEPRQNRGGGFGGRNRNRSNFGGGSQGDRY